MMDTIDAIIVRHQSSRGMSPSNVKRKAEAASAEESAAKKKKSAAAAEASKKEDLVIFNPHLRLEL